MYILLQKQFPWWETYTKWEERDRDGLEYVKIWESRKGEEEEKMTEGEKERIKEPEVYIYIHI